MVQVIVPYEVVVIEACSTRPIWACTSSLLLLLSKHTYRSTSNQGLFTIIGVKTGCGVLVIQVFSRMFLESMVTICTMLHFGIESAVEDCFLRSAHIVLCVGYMSSIRTHVHTHAHTHTYTHTRVHAHMYTHKHFLYFDNNILTICINIMVSFCTF